ncbi:nitroreductase/quinone reductase family protein [Amycolatopsis nigrescens]|uniref:nitroreductase/quinone reductase family protein n=1 Tax=Amycolatopsis nigrescens TaxID=381445 RepID=UPI0003A45503|nr:nitroreductase/quinone reductase family protein [Amycolatopsis nigrescens]
MSTPDTTGSNDSARDASLSHLPNHIRRAIEITPAAGTRERIIDITTLGRRTGRARRIEIFFYRAAGETYLCSGAGGAATDWHANLLANPNFTFHLKTGSVQICLHWPRLSPTQLNARPCWRRSSRISISPTTPAPSGRLGSKPGLTVG